MNKNILRTLILTVALVSLTLFINIDTVKADSGIRCRYNYSATNFEGTDQAYDSEIIVDVYYGKNGNDYSMRATCTRYVGVLAKDTSCIDSENYNSIFNNPNKYKDNFVNGSNYKCPSELYGQLFGTTDQKIKFHSQLVSHPWWDGRYNKKFGYSDSCEANASLNACKKNSDNQRMDKSEKETEEKSEKNTGSERKAKQAAKGTISTDDIKNWAKSKTSKTKYTEECDNVISPTMRKMLNNLFTIIQVIGIILMVILTASEFIKIITGSEEDGLRSAFKHTIVRIVVVVILLLLPMFINWILNVVEIQNASGKDATICSLQINHNNLLE